MHIWDYFCAVFKSQLITGYIFPICSGVWLAFVTANLILLRSAKARAIVALRGLRWEFLRMNSIGNPQDFQAALFQLGQPVLDAADELEAHGYVATSQVFRSAVLRFQNPFAERLQMLYIEHGLFGSTRDDFNQLNFHLVLRKFVPVATTAIINEADSSIEMIRNCRTEWLAVAELKTLAAIVERSGRGRRSDCRCPLI